MTATATLSPSAWCPGGTAPFAAPFASPGGAAVNIVGWALDYVYPLPVWRDQLIADEDQVAGFAAHWDTAAREPRSLEDECSRAVRDLEAMTGKSVRALRAALEAVGLHAAHASEWTEASAASLELASRIVSMVHDAVVGALHELAALVEALFDVGLGRLNPVEQWKRLRTLVGHVDHVVDALESLIDQLFDACESFMRLIRAVEPLVVDAITELRDLTSRIVDAAGAPLGALIGGLAGGPLGAGVGTVTGDLAGGVLSDWLALSPEVRALDRDDLSLASHQASYDQAMAARELRSLESFVVQNGHTDAMGEQDRTVIDIKKVTGDDGTSHWVVSLPSTQDWNILKGVFDEEQWDDMLADYPATNDLDTNVALMLADHPEIATQYQRGVYDAMQQAGIPTGAPVVYTGFSQGGIMSAALAADTQTPYTPIGIVTTGAPVDRFDIPAAVAVAAFGHRSDPVAHIDEYIDAAGQAATVVGGPVGLVVGPSIVKPPGADLTITLPDPHGTGGNPAPSVHSVDGYRQTISQWEAAHPEAASAILNLVGGDIVDHQTYSFGE